MRQGSNFSAQACIAEHRIGGQKRQIGLQGCKHPALAGESWDRYKIASAHHQFFNARHGQHQLVGQCLKRHGRFACRDVVAVMCKVIFEQHVSKDTGYKVNRCKVQPRQGVKRHLAQFSHHGNRPEHVSGQLGVIDASR